MKVLAISGSARRNGNTARRTGALHAVDAMDHFFLNHDMFLAGSTYWAVGYGRLPGDVTSDVEALATARRLGENVAWFLQRKEGT